MNRSTKSWYAVRRKDNGEFFEGWVDNNHFHSPTPAMAYEFKSIEDAQEFERRFKDGIKREIVVVKIETEVLPVFIPQENRMTPSSATEQST